MDRVGRKFLAFQKRNVIDPRVIKCDLSLLNCKNLLSVHRLTQWLSEKYSVHLQLARWSLLWVVVVDEVEETCQVLSIEVKLVEIISDVGCVDTVSAESKVAQFVACSNNHRKLLKWGHARVLIHSLQLDAVIRIRHINAAVLLHVPRDCIRNCVVARCGVVPGVGGGVNCI